MEREGSVRVGDCYKRQQSRRIDRENERERERERESERERERGLRLFVIYTMGYGCQFKVSYPLQRLVKVNQIK